MQAAVGSHCLDCARAARPDLKTRANWWNARQHALVTTVLIAVNLAVFVAMVISDPDSLTGRGITEFQANYGLNVVALQAPFDEWYRLVTNGFVHFGAFHLAFNMFALYQLGNLLERPLGRLRFALLYLAGILGGSFGVLVFGGDGLTPDGFVDSITGGASGAVFALMAAAAIGFQRQGVNIMSTGLGTTLMLNFFITFAIPGISIGGHLGGAAAGAAAGWFMLTPSWKLRSREQGRRLALVAPIAVAVFCLAASVAYALTI